MTLDKARSMWEAKHPKGNFDALSHEEQMAILTDAVLAERAARKK